MQYNNTSDERRRAQPGHNRTGSPQPGSARRTAPPSRTAQPARGQNADAARRLTSGGSQPDPSPGKGKRRRAPKQKVKNRWFRAIVMVVATLTGCLFLAVFILSVATDMFGFQNVDQNVEVVIPEGSTNSDIAAILEDQGVIDYAFVFKMYSDIKTKDKPFQAGTYVFNSNMGYDEIIVDLRSGNSTREEVRITIVEGLTIAEIAQELQTKKVCDAQEWMDYLQVADQDFDYEFLNAVPNDDLRYLKLEGYIFPDTYDFFVGESVQEVTRKFLRNFNTKMTDELQEKMLDVGLSMDETIILASIIQKEAARQDDMHLVSSAFHNRLSNSGVYPRLQSDVTVFYVNDFIKPYLTQTDQEMYDAYNTYVTNGLPVGAICNPGMDSIRAALYPTDSNYYFFVTNKDGEFYYAETADEHYRNVAQAIADGGDAHGIDTMD